MRLTMHHPRVVAISDLTSFLKEYRASFPSLIHLKDNENRCCGNRCCPSGKAIYAEEALPHRKGVVIRREETLFLNGVERLEGCPMSLEEIPFEQESPLPMGTKFQVEDMVFLSQIMLKVTRIVRHPLGFLVTEGRIDESRRSRSGIPELVLSLIVLPEYTA